MYDCCLLRLKMTEWLIICLWLWRCHSCVPCICCCGHLWKRANTLVLVTILKSIFVDGIIARLCRIDPIMIIFILNDIMLNAYLNSVLLVRFHAWKGPYATVNWVGLWLVTYSAPSHYLKNCWLIVYWGLRWNLDPHWTIFIEELGFKCRRLKNMDHFV